MNSNISEDTKIAGIRIRLGDLFRFISDISFDGFQDFKSSYLEIIENPNRQLSTDLLTESTCESELSLEKLDILRLIYDYNGYINFLVPKEYFIKNFEDFYYPGDNIIVINNETKKPICYLDHEEFAIIPTEF